MEGIRQEPRPADEHEVPHHESEPLVELLGQAERLRKIRDLGAITPEEYGELLRQLLTRL